MGAVFDACGVQCVARSASCHVHRVACAADYADAPHQYYRQRRCCVDDHHAILTTACLAGQPEF
eukprot:2846272-Amphidinium_carterae.1